MKLFTENPDFYPTPVEVIDKMMMGEDIIGKTILEPSAGSGWLRLPSPAPLDRVQICRRCHEGCQIWTAGRVPGLPVVWF